MSKPAFTDCPHLQATPGESVAARQPGVLLEPPSPKLPPWKVALRFMKNPFDTISAARAECGDLFVLQLPGLGRVAFLCRADLLHQVYRMPEEDVVAGEIRGRILAELTGEKVSTCLDGEEFKDRRRVMAPFLNGRKVEEHIPFIVRLTEGLIDELQTGNEQELQKRFDHLTRMTISRILFGARSAAQVDHLTELVSRYLEAFEWRAVQMPFLRKHLGPWSPWTRFKKRHRALYEALEDEVRGITSGGEAAGEHGDDLMAALVAAGLYEDSEESIDAAVQELIGLAVGGAETTSKALSWTVRGLLTERSAWDGLRQELDEVLGDRPLEARDLKQLPYLEAVVHEGLRHQSVGPFAGPRLAKKEIQVGGYRIPPGTAMVQALHEVGRGPLFPDPETFDPNHFYGCEVKQRDWVPFGGGTRKCTGMGLALVELSAVVATLVQRTEMTLGSGPTGPIQAGIAHRPRNNMRVRFGGRRAPA